MPSPTARVARERRATQAPHLFIPHVSPGRVRRAADLRALILALAVTVAPPSRARAAPLEADIPASSAADAGTAPEAAAPGAPHTAMPGGPEARASAASVPPAQTTVVTARRLPSEAPREDLTASASVLRPADSPRARDDLGTLLLEVPGTNVTRAGGLGSFAAISLRGANPDDVRIYVDGIPLNQAVGGAVDLSTLPLGDVERVEVYRGSAPMAFGQSALGGVVSISTRTPLGTQASARAGLGSFRTMSSDLTAGGSLGRLRLYAGVHLLRAVGDFPDAPPLVSGGYQPSARENTDLAQLDGVVRAVLPLTGRREVRAGYIGLGRDQGLPAQNIFRSNARATARRDLAHVDYESRDDLGASSHLRTALFASYTRDEFRDPDHQIVGVPTATRDVTRLVGLTAIADKALFDWSRLTAMVEGRAEDYRPHNQLDPAATAGYPARRMVASGGLELDLHSEQLDLDVIPSLRLEGSRDVRTGRDPTFGTELPPTDPIARLLPVMRLGLLRPLGGGVSARANVGRYARIPSFVELYGYNRGVVGSPDLRREKGVNADLGLALTSPAPERTLTASGTLFGAQVDDLIAWQTYSGRTRAENISRARIWGVETELRLRVWRLTLTTQATLVDARDRGPIASQFDRQLDHHPRYRGYGRLEWRQPVDTAGLVVCAYADLDGSAGNFRTTGPYSALPARLLAGAGLVMEHLRSGLRLAATALNLTDRRVEDFANYPLPGRSVYVTLGWSSVASLSPP